MFANGAFGAIVRFSEAIRTGIRAITTYASTGVSKLSLFAISHTGTNVSGSVEKSVPVAERAIFWRPRALLAVRTASTAAPVSCTDEVPRRAAI